MKSTGLNTEYHESTPPPLWTDYPSEAVCCFTLGAPRGFKKVV